MYIDYFFLYIRQNIAVEFQKGVSQLAVKILFGDSTGFDEMRWIIILQEKQKS